MKQPQRRPAIKEFLRDERGAVAVVLTLLLPLFVSFLALTIDMAYAYKTRNMLQVAAESAALAATSQLPNPTTSCALAKQYADTNMPHASYGWVLKQSASDCSDVILGKWDQNCTGIGCWHELPAGQTCLTFSCNAAKVTTRMSAANSNPLQLFFAQMFGIPTVDVTATAIAVFGSNSVPWDISVVQDISGSFTRPPRGGQGALPQAKAADKALLDCLKSSSPAGTRLGMTVFTGTALAFQTPSAVNTSYDALKAKIDTLPQCQNTNPPPAGNTTPLCSTGTDISAGINASMAEFTSSPNPIGVSQKNIVIVTDGLPTAVNGSYCNGNSGCENTAKQNAVNAVDAAYDQGNGANVYTIYYCSGNSCDPTARTWLGGLVRGTGTALVTPDPNNLSTLMGQICASQPHRLVW